MRIKVGNSELDIDKGSVLAVTLQADSIEAVEQVNSSYTTPTELPFTKTNVGVLGNIQALQEGASYTNVENAEVFDEEGRRVMTNSFLQVEEVEDAFKVRVLQGAVDIFEILGDATLQDFGLNTLVPSPVAKTEANIVANIDNDYLDRYTWATADFGNDPNGTYAIKAMFPFVYYYTIVKEIIEYAGYTLDESSALPSDAFFRTCTLAYNGGNFNEDNQFAVSLQGFTSSGGATVGYQSFAVQDIIKGSDLFNFFNYYLPVSSKPQIHEVFANWEIDLDGTGNWRYKVRLFNVTDNVEVAELYDSGAQSGTPSSTITDSFRVYFKTDDLVEGKAYQLQVDLETALNFDVLTGYWRNDDGSGYIELGGTKPPNEQLYSQPPDDYTFDPLFVMPELSMKDFLKAVLQQFSARLSVDNIKKTVGIRLRDNDFQDTANAKNWSSKINLRQSPKKKKYFGNYGKVNLFKYDNDEPLNELAGAGSINITNNKAPAEYDVVELPFSFSEVGQDGVVIPIVDDQNEVVEELNPRCCYMAGGTGTITVGSTSVSSYNVSQMRNFAFRLNDSDASGNISQAGLLPNYYQSVEAILSRMEELTLSVKLSSLDFEQLDFNVPYLLTATDGDKQVNGYYAIEKVDQYQGGGVPDIIFIALNIDLI